MEFEKEILKNLESEELWTIVTFKTPDGPTKTLEKLIGILKDSGWRVTFKANWWTADVPYGIARLDLRKDGREKILLGRWILGRRYELIGVENMPLETGKEEFFRLVDGITSTLIHDPVIRTMREQY
ncbi:ribonucleoside-triphosphate reductase [Thermococcus sp. P6]|uniref:ribonucleoside-triphosphate reductase n=1 Tax=Thermococcus sp. P6 TaxID=122420 RepID=UPI000B598A8B|nr:ribonucleoside-triphosphate reductase [Thermococcus sp. P6]ASJ10426.1 ribonucleoside-triphosphate reductase [Thermococcus sp. P6]